MGSQQTDKLRHWGTNFLYVSVLPERSTNFARIRYFFWQLGELHPPRPRPPPRMLSSSSSLSLNFLPSTLTWRLQNHDARTFVNEANKDAESHLAGSYTQEGLMICPIYMHPFCIVTSCNPRYSMRCLFRWIFFSCSSEAKISSRGIPKGGSDKCFILKL